MVVDVKTKMRISNINEYWGVAPALGADNSIPQEGYLGNNERY